MSGSVGESRSRDRSNPMTQREREERHNEYINTSGNAVDLMKTVTSTNFSVDHHHMEWCYASLKKKFQFYIWMLSVFVSFKSDSGVLLLLLCWHFLIRLFQRTFQIILVTKKFPNNVKLENFNAGIYWNNRRGKKERKTQFFSKEDHKIHYLTKNIDTPVKYNKRAQNNIYIYMKYSNFRIKSL